MKGDPLVSFGFVCCVKKENERGDLLHYLRCIFKSEVVRNFLAQEQWEVLDWPAYSPDLNPIENIWAIFKKSLRGQIVTWENLEEKVMEVWNNINPDVVRNLYSSYENRLVKVIKNHGSLTGY